MSQSVASTIRQVLAVLVSIYGVLTASISQLHLPVPVSTVLVAVAPIIFGIEHYLSDPSTGTSVVTTPTAQKQTTPVLPTVVTQVVPQVLAPAPTVTYIPSAHDTAAPNVVVDPNVVGPYPAPPAPGVVH